MSPESEDAAQAEIAAEELMVRVAAHPANSGTRKVKELAADQRTDR